MSMSARCAEAALPAKARRPGSGRSAYVGCHTDPYAPAGSRRNAQIEGAVSTRRALRVSSAAAIVLAGGAARRLGGVHKPALEVGGEPIIGRVLRAVQQAGLTAVVVGRPGGVPRGIPVWREDPPGGGPVVAVREGLRHLPQATGGAARDVAVVVLLAADLPFVSAPTLERLLSAVAQDPSADLAVYVDQAGRPQWLCSAWRVTALRARLADGAAPGGIRGLAQGLRRRELADPDGAASTDVDTREDLLAARVRCGHGRGPDAAAVRVGDHAEPEAGSGPAGG